MKKISVLKTLFGIFLIITCTACACRNIEKVEIEPETELNIRPQSKEEKKNNTPVLSTDNILYYQNY